MSVHVEKSGPVTTVVMERPNVRNAVDPATADALVAAFESFDRDTEAKAAVFFGSHGSFCAGWDLKYGATLAGKDVRRELDLDFPQGGAAPPRGPMGLRAGGRRKSEGGPPRGGGRASRGSRKRRKSPIPSGR